MEMREDNRMNELPKVYIVIVNYNATEDTVECVNYLEKLEYKKYYILVVDNGSNPPLLKSSKALVMRNEVNLGYAGGANLGIKFALGNGADYVLLLNNDTIIKDTTILNKMLEPFSNNPSIGMVGPKILYYKNPEIIWSGGGKVSKYRAVGIHLNENRSKTAEDIKEVKEVDFLTGCCWLVKKEVFKKLDYLDEKYFMYYEDMDFCKRVVDNGYKIVYTPFAEIYHKVESSNMGGFLLGYYATRNRMLFVKKYYKYLQKILFYLFFIPTRIAKILFFLITFRIKSANGIIVGFKDGVLKKTGKQLNIERL